MGRPARWLDLSDESSNKHSIHQLIVHLKSSYREKDFNRVEQILVEREERIRAESAAKNKGGREKGKTEEVLEEKLRKVEEEKEELMRLNLRAEEVCNKLYYEMKEVEESGKDQVTKLELKVRVEQDLRKKAEKELNNVWEQFKEQEELVMKLIEEIKAKNQPESLDDGAAGGGGNEEGSNGGGNAVPPLSESIGNSRMAGIRYNCFGV